MRALGAIFLSVAGLILAWIAWSDVPDTVSTLPVPVQATVDEAYQMVYAYVSGYNTVIAQTDESPCIAATGSNICGRRNVVACPRSLRLGTVVEIHGKPYLCEDRTARKFDGRFDINCDKDKSCPFRVAGWTNVKVYEN